MSARAALMATGVATLIAGAVHAERGNTYSTVERGQYLVRAGDCAACHTLDDEAPLAGGYPLPTPFGVIYSANLTPDDETGLGKWDESDFWRAMNEGRRRDGARLYPAFPYTHFTLMTREDSDAIFYYLQTIDPVRRPTPEPELPWPLSMRVSLMGWNLLNFEDRAFIPDPERSDAWNRGKYLVDGLAHCAMCHSPKNFIGAVKTGDEAFTGGEVEGWWAPELVGAKPGGVQSWAKEELVEFLKTGRNARTAAFGPMADVIEDSTRHLSDADLGAIAEYILSLPTPEEAEAPDPVDADGGAMRRGALIYETQCSACHGPEGEGVEYIFPAIRGSAIAQADNPLSVIRLILEGAQSSTTDVRPTAHAMPPFDWKLTDEDTAAVATYIRNAFGNAAPAVDPNAVAEVRRAR